MTPKERSHRAADLFKDRLRAVRRQAGLTQDQLGDKAGIAAVTLSKLEAGTNRPSLDIFVSLAHALEASPNFLLGWDSQPETVRDASRRQLLMRLGAAVERLPDEWIEQLISLAERAASKQER